MRRAFTMNSTPCEEKKVERKVCKSRGRRGCANFLCREPKRNIPRCSSSVQKLKRRGKRTHREKAKSRRQKVQYETSTNFGFQQFSSKHCVFQNARTKGEKKQHHYHITPQSATQSKLKEERRGAKKKKMSANTVH